MLLFYYCRFNKLNVVCFQHLLKRVMVWNAMKPIIEESRPSATYGVMPIFSISKKASDTNIRRNQFLIVWLVFSPNIPVVCVEAHHIIARIEQFLQPFHVPARLVA